jgi:hypothetical protein
MNQKKLKPIPGFFAKMRRSGSKAFQLIKNNLIKTVRIGSANTSTCMLSSSSARAGQSRGAAMTRHSADEFVSSDVTGMDVIVPESERAAPDGGHSAPATTNSVRRRRGRPKTSAEQRAAKEAAVAEKKAAHKAAATKEKLRREAEKAGLTLIEGTEEISEILRLGDLRITEYAPRTLEPHPLCSMLPLMTNEELYEFIEDIRRHGQREPGTTLDGKILDGRSRDLAGERGRHTVPGAPVRRRRSARVRHFGQHPPSAHDCRAASRVPGEPH